MDNDMLGATERLVEDMTEVVRREREKARSISATPEAEKFRQQYRSALRSMNLLTEREAGQLMRSASPK
ncbi:MAG: hypothetical protein JWS10_1527 [Cypionkella sp.]|uniref:hypothetical protein n=1 Tax=Cypionkella sp. TaxID=2811411 RepID=UPI002611580C|nr:hypothetical protein [Cypionkella sp.]MDB5658912.1 hypothetical protein [Cypionkella sp.]